MHGEYVIALIEDFINRLHRLEAEGENESVSRRKCIFCDDADAAELKTTTGENYEASNFFLHCERCGWTKQWALDNSTKCDEWNELFLNPEIFLKNDEVVKQN